MEWHFPDPKTQKLSTQILSSKALIHIWKWNKIFPQQKEARYFANTKPALSQHSASSKMCRREKEVSRIQWQQNGSPPYQSTPNKWELNRDPNTRATGPNHNLSVLTLNMNDLNSSIKWPRLTECIKKHHPSICCLQEIHLINKDKQTLKVKQWKRIFHGNVKEKRASVAFLTSDDRLQCEKHWRRWRGTLLNDKGIYPAGRNSNNIYTLNTRAPGYMKQLLTDLKLKKKRKKKGIGRPKGRYKCQYNNSGGP